MVDVVVDPDLLAQGTEITLNKTSFLFDLNDAGDLSGAKVSGQCLYTWFIDETETDSDLPKLPRPIDVIDATTFEFTVWEPTDDDARKKLARCGWAELDASSVAKQKWACIQSNGSVPSDTPAYYILSSQNTAIDFSTDGLPEEGVKIYGDATHGNFDRTTDELTINYRREGSTLASVSVRATYGASVLEPKNYIITLEVENDAKITDADIDIDANSDGDPDQAPYSTPTLTYYPGTGFTEWADSTVYAAGAVVWDDYSGVVRWYRTAGGGTSSGTNVSNDTGITDWAAFGGEIQINDVYYPFWYVIANANSCSRGELYTLMHFWCRQSVNVDTGDSIVGRTLPELSGWDGDTLVTTQGVGITGPQAIDVNNLRQTDCTGVERAESYIAAGKLVFDTVEQADANARYELYYGWGTTSAVVVEDSDGNPIEGDVGGNDEIVFSFDYDGNSQGGHTPGTDMVVSLVVIGQGGTGWSLPGNATITRSVENIVNSAGVRDRVYSNP